MRRIIAIYLLSFVLAGCEVRTMYGIQVSDFPEDGMWKTVRRNDHTLYISGTNHPEFPGLYLIALSNDQADPPWEREEYQTWPLEKQASFFGEYFDRKYADLTVVHQSTCPLKKETFDHRESAQEVAYGRWLNNLPRESGLDDYVKGLHVQIPVAECEELANSSPGSEEKLTVILGDQDRITITFRVEAVDTWIDFWLF